MIAYRIKLNGKLILTASQEDWSLLSAHVTASRDNGEQGVVDYIRFSMGGLSKELPHGYPEHFRWSDWELSLGDKVEIEIVDINEPDPPKKRYRSDKEKREDPFTEEELKEMRYQDYLELKKEFEGVDHA